jgi:hypothetical protein
LRTVLGPKYPSFSRLKNPYPNAVSAKYENIISGKWRRIRNTEINAMNESMMDAWLWERGQKYVGILRKRVGEVVQK